MIVVEPDEPDDEPNDPVSQWEHTLSKITQWDLGLSQFQTDLGRAWFPNDLGLAKFQTDLGISKFLDDSFTRAIVEPITSRLTESWSLHESSIIQLSDQLQRSISQTLASEVSRITQWSELWDERWRTLLESLSTSYPENWQEITHDPTPELLNQIVRDEGLPLCWVPPWPILQRILDAKSGTARREIIGRSSPRILDECEQQMDHITSAPGRRYVRYVKASIRALRDGHRDAGQALATNTLDTLIRRHGLKPPARNNPPDLGEFDLTDALVLGALWATYFSFNGESPTAVPPREFRRHATAHGVSARQYTLRNATIAIMHLTAVLRWLEINGFQRFGKDFWR